MSDADGLAAGGGGGGGGGGDVEPGMMVMARLRCHETEGTEEGEFDFAFRFGPWNGNGSSRY